MLVMGDTFNAPASIEPKFPLNGPFASAKDWAGKVQFSKADSDTRDNSNWLFVKSVYGSKDQTKIGWTRVEHASLFHDCTGTCVMFGALGITNKHRCNIVVGSTGTIVHVEYLSDTYKNQFSFTIITINNCRTVCLLWVAVRN